MGESKRRQHFYRQAPHERLGDQPVQAEYYDHMKTVAQVVDKIFNGDAKGDDRAIGFVLMVFPFGDRDGRCNYLSNGADRADVVTLMKEMIARFEGQPELKGEA